MRKIWKLSRAVRACALLLCGIMLLAFAGCEPDMENDYAGVDAYFDENPYSSETRDDPKPPELIVQPAEKAIGIVGEVAVFKAQGGVGPYRWNIGNTEYGRIEVLGWSEAIYTCVKVGNNTVMVHDRQGHSAVARIIHVLEHILINPAAVVLDVGESHVGFSVSGGSPPYTWHVGNPALGTISYSAHTSHVAGYTAAANMYGDNVVTVMDAQGQAASASVIRPSP